MDRREVVHSELVRNDLIYIEPTYSSMKEYKKLIKNQGSQVCQDEMTLDAILSNIQDFNFGFLHISTKATIGARRLSISDRQSLNGFIFCKYLEDVDMIMIEMICSRKHMKLGKQLMRAIEEIAIEMGVHKLALCSLAEEKLKNWYVSLGFKVVTAKPLPSGELKSYFMTKVLY